jgi:hypothetical protein
MNLPAAQSPVNVPGSATPDPAAAWRERAEDLAAWAERLANRRDCWGGYRPPEEWGRKYTRRDGTAGELGKTTTRKGPLTRGVLARQFRALAREDIVGLHSTAPDNTSRWGALDIDWHGATSTAPAVNLAAALHWYAVLVGMGFRPLLVDSNGKGGFHLWALLAGTIPTSRLYHFLRRLVADYARHGMTAPAETFPKQPALRPLPDGRPGYGNWLRLPGRHHSHDHWSRIWNGASWLDGAAAVDHLLTLTGDPPDLVPEVPPPTAPPRCTAQSYCTPPPAGGNLSARIAAYAAQLPHLAAGQGRDDVAFHFASWLVRDMALADDIALEWLERWDAGNSPPKGRAVLAEILANAHRYGRHAYGSGRPAVGPRRDRHGHTVIQSRAEG